MKWAIWTAGILVLLTGAACQEKHRPPDTPQAGSNTRSPTLVVATAANVQFAMNDLELAFEEQTAIPVDVVISSSGKLTTQIQQGAPYDLLVSADMKYPQALFDNGFAASEPRIYAYGTLVLWTIKEVPLQSDLAFLNSAGIRKIAIANPKNAPYGEESIRALEYFDAYNRLKPKLVYGESIAQTNQYITSGAVELGFTAKSVVLSPKAKGRGTWIEVLPKAYRPIEQGIIITRYGLEKHPEESRKFYTFLFSGQARQILAKYGYGLPKEE